ncbi:hypothetical protein BpHYR1_017741 [Brachionus plicatilis]|uniref:RING-type domain-containing protein n=1 Tax=Brachionus plicatilis TaxID=10195 RepID=A0A3M7S722_BRAPC|nr:hypothetical protein BpHYR1_017741 [Brachionus plicatilis]
MSSCPKSKYTPFIINSVNQGSYHDIRKNLVIITQSINNEFSRPFISKVASYDVISWLNKQCVDDLMDKITDLAYIEPNESCSPPKIQKRDEVFTCPICIRDFNEIKLNNEKSYAARCGHIYCESCFDMLLGEKKEQSCCLCQTKLNRESSIKLFI